MADETQPQESFAKQVFSNSTGGSSIRICLVGIVTCAIYCCIFDVSAHKGFTAYSCYVVLALITLMSGGYVVNKIVDPLSMVPDSGIGGMLKKLIKPATTDQETPQ